MISKGDVKEYIKRMEEKMKEFLGNLKLFDEGMPEIELESCSLALQHILQDEVVLNLGKYIDEVMM